MAIVSILAKEIDLGNWSIAPQLAKRKGIHCFILGARINHREDQTANTKYPVIHTMSSFQTL
jgi:hypothetical protein